MSLKRITLSITSYFYLHFLKPVFFIIDPETIHILMTSMGELFGRLTLTRWLFSKIFSYHHPSTSQVLLGINFATPVGLAAGFDYEARLTQTLPSLGFGFGTVGTISNLPYEGNPRPRLGRLIRSHSLLVNKGFKNSGVKHLITKLSSQKFTHALGISLGKTNISAIDTQSKAIADLVSAFSSVINSRLKPSYFELNISCPNLFGTVEFYHPDHLTELLTALSKLQITIPVFVKLPVSKTDQEFLSILHTLDKFNFIKGVIVGNLQTDRRHPLLIPSEVDKFPRGNFSGAPTFDASNHFIALTYQHYSTRFLIIGCGGIFSADDAYTKIKLGASLVQLITGMILEGPQLISQINMGLVSLLKVDGFSHISQAVGVESVNYKSITLPSVINTS